MLSSSCVKDTYSSPKMACVLPKGNKVFLRHSVAVSLRQRPRGANFGTRLSLSFAPWSTWFLRRRARLERRRARLERRRASGIRVYTRKKMPRPLTSLALLSPLLLLLPYISLRFHYHLPAPNADLIDPITGAPLLSEVSILSDTRVLSEDIGFRTVGTREHMLGDEWWEKRARGVCEDAEKAWDEIEKTGGGKRLWNCEVERQIGSGTHRFDIMGKRLYKVPRPFPPFVTSLANHATRIT